MVPKFWPALVKVETHYDPPALHDNTTNRSYYPSTADAAEAITAQLMGMGHSVSVGLSQLTVPLAPLTELQNYAEVFGTAFKQARVAFGLS